MSEQMVAYQCTSCGELHHPKHFVCLKCGARQFEEIPLEGACTCEIVTTMLTSPAFWASVKAFLIPVHTCSSFPSI